jgi:hypothetical protein
MQEGTHLDHISQFVVMVQNFQLSLPCFGQEKPYLHLHFGQKRKIKTEKKTKQ